jgi:predicted MPP superfamily phosphohydrolase
MRFGLFRTILQSFLFFGHLFLYFTVVKFFGVDSPWRRLILKITLGVLFLSLIPASFLASRYSNLWVRCFYTAAASWVGIIYLLVLACILCWILYALARLFHLPLDKKILIRVLIGMAVIVGLYGFINSGMIRVTRIAVQLHDLPNEWKGKHAVWVSDTHLGPVRNNGFAQHIATMIQNLQPDIVFIGGDLFDGEPVGLDKIIEPFSQISAPYGIYFITGNHEEFSDNTPYLQAVRRMGMRVLNNEMVEISGLQIIGVDYRDTRREDQFKEILQKIKINPHKPSILLKHAPLNLQVARDQGISLQLSGHTHHGQIFLLQFITSQVYHGYDYGLRWFSDLLVYTSSGAGTWGPPIRVDTKPEIVFITFM